MRGVVFIFLCVILSVAAPAEAKVIRDIIYSEGENIDPGDVRMDIHLPKEPESAPVLIMIHGGAWTYGNKHTYIGLEQARFFNRNGYIFIPINYRLAPDHPFPAAIEDAAAAIAWVHENIAEYGGDPSKIVLMGHSAGAHSVAMVSVDPTYLAAHNLSPAVIRGAIALDSAAYDLVEKGARRGQASELLSARLRQRSGGLGRSFAKASGETGNRHPAAAALLCPARRFTP